MQNAKDISYKPNQDGSAQLGFKGVEMQVSEEQQKQAAAYGL